ncbi:MAG: hypothetical protein WBW92_11185 [Rhodanobacteraceae bacterium]
MKKTYFAAVIALLLSACSADPQIVKQANVPRDTEIGVIPFRDCMIPGQDEDCNGSGNVAGTVFARAFSEDGFRSELLSRPIGAKEALSDEAALALAKEKNLAFVINGEVTQFYSVAAGTFRPDRAGISVRILRVADGEVAVSYSVTRASKTNFATPEGMIEDMAEEVRDELE